MSKTEPKWAQQGMKMFLGTKFVKKYLTGALKAVLTYQEKLTNRFQGSERVDEQKPVKRIEQKAKDLEASFTVSFKIATYFIFQHIIWMMMMMCADAQGSVFGHFPLLFVS